MKIDVNFGPRGLSVAVDGKTVVGDRSKEEKLAAAKAVYESAMRRASTPNERAEARENYESTVRSIQATGDAGEELIGKRIRFKVPGPNGPMTKVGTVKPGVRPGEPEVKSQEGGYYKLSQIGPYEVVG